MSQCATCRDWYRDGHLCPELTIREVVKGIRESISKPPLFDHRDAMKLAAIQFLGVFPSDTKIKDIMAHPPKMVFPNVPTPETLLE